MQLLEKLEGVRQTGAHSWSAKCPSHADGSPSLVVNELSDRILMHCHAGCDISSVMSTLNLEWRDLFTGDAERAGSPVVVDEYEYRDDEGRLVYVVERLAPKSFRQRKLLPDGSWEWNLDGVPRLLYRQNKLAAAREAGRWILIVEGEKDVKTLEQSGFVATTVSGGSGAWRDDFAEHFTGAKVAVIPDADEPGRKYASKVAASLANKTRDLRVVTLPELRDGQDCSFFLNGHGGKPEDIKRLILNAPSYLPTPTRTLASVTRRQVEWLWQDRIPQGKLTILAGVQGTGKSQLSLALASALTQGQGFPGISRASDSLFITYEDDPHDTIRPRAEDFGADLGRIHVWDARAEPFDVVSDLPRLKALMQARPEIELIVLDPLVSALGLDDAYRETEVRKKLMMLLSLGKTVLGIMHQTKAVDQSSLYRVAGSVAFTALARSVLLLEDGWVRVIKSNVAGRSEPVKCDIVNGKFAVYP